MKAPTKLILIALFALLSPLATFAAAADVMVVVDGNTEVNREAYNYIRKTFNYNNINYSIAATLDPSSVKSGQYKTVVVLNTGISSGVDPLLQKFISGYSDKKNLFLVNLYRNKGDLSVTTFTPATNPEGLDGVSAASTWMRGFANNAGVQEMHMAWIKALVKFLGRA